MVGQPHSTARMSPSPDPARNATFGFPTEDDGATPTFGALAPSEEATLPESSELGETLSTLAVDSVADRRGLFGTLRVGPSESALSRPSCLPEYIELLDLVGGGSMGRVWAARDRRTEQALAVKESRLGGTSYIQALKREFRLGSDIVHPNVVGMGELFIDEQSCAITMEWVQGREFDVAWPEVGLREAFSALVEGLGAVHEAGLVHGDLKCRNVLVTAAGRVVLVDFGLAQVASPMAPALGGTLAYMAPEIRKGGSPSVAADLFALGVMLYRALTGQHPRWRDSTGSDSGARDLPFERPEVVAPDVDRSLARLAEQLMAEEPLDRPSLRTVLTVLGAGGVVPRTWWVPRPALEDQLLQASATGSGTRYVALVGPSGAGKSSLLRQFLARSAVRPVWSRCDPLEQVAWRGFDAIADQIPRSLGRPARWSEGVARDVLQAGALFPQLRGRPGDLPTTITDLGRQRAVASLAGLVNAASERVPLAVVVDDVQWLGRDARKLFPGFLAALQGDISVYLIARRTSDLPAGISWSVVDVSPIDPSALLSGELDAPPSFLRPPPRADSDVMSAWEAEVRADVAALGPDIETAVRWCALAGGPIELSHLKRLGVESATIRAAVRERVLRRQTEGRFRVVSVVHARVEGALDLSDFATVDARARLGEILATGPQRWARSAIVHLEQAGQPEAATMAMARAGHWALTRGAFDDAVALLQAARDRGAPPRAWGLVLGQALLALGRTHDAVAVWRAARESTEGIEQVRLSSRIIDLEFGHGRTKVGLDEIAAMLESVGEKLPASTVSAAWQALGFPAFQWFESAKAKASPDAVRLEALWHSARAISIVAPLTAAFVHLRHERLAERTQQPTALVLTASWRMWTQRGQGQSYRAAEARIHSLMHRHPEIVDQYPEIHHQIESSRAAGCLVGGELAEAGDRFDVVGTEWRAMRGECWEVRFCRAACLQARLHEWPLEESERLIEEFRAEAEALGDVRSSTVLALAAGHYLVLYRQGDPAAHARYVESAAAAWDDLLPPESELRLIVARAHVCLASGDIDGALQLMRSAPLRVTSLRSFHMGRMAFDGLHARILAHQPSVRRSVRQCLRLTRALRGTNADILVGQAAGLEAGLALHRGDEAEARRLRDEALLHLDRSRQVLMAVGLRESDDALRARGFADPQLFRRIVFGPEADGLHAL